MSVIIHGLDMPKSCDECFFCDDWAKCQLLNLNNIFDYCKDGIERPAKCPLVPLPEGHGELIDKQAFIADIAGFIKRMSNVGVLVDGETMWGKLLDALANAKTIVPAEGGNADGN